MFPIFKREINGLIRIKTNLLCLTMVFSVLFITQVNSFCHLHMDLLNSKFRVVIHRFTSGMSLYMRKFLRTWGTSNVCIRGRRLRPISFRIFSLQIDSNDNGFSVKQERKIAQIFLYKLTSSSYKIDSVRSLINTSLQHATFIIHLYICWTTCSQNVVHDERKQVFLPFSIFPTSWSTFTEDTDLSIVHCRGGRANIRVQLIIMR